MTELGVWAPRARSIVAVVGPNHRRVPLVRADDGWHRADVAGLGPGDDYAFEVDGRGPYPDPRSAWQPFGVDGPSRLVDHTAFEWTDGDWAGVDARQVVLYELHVGTFSPRGDFDGVVERLDHLVDLGIGAIQLLPVGEFPGTRNWGYDGVCLYAPHHAYGGPDGLKRLVDACHRRGIAVLVDVVYNHLGPEGNHLGVFGPYFTDAYTTPWGQALNFDQPDCDEVRAFVVDNAVSWLRDHHLDGLRIDAVHTIVDTTAVHVLEEIAAAVDALSAEVGRPHTLIAESTRNDPRACWPRERGGHGLHAQWNDDFHHALHVALTGESTGYYVDFDGLESLAATLRHGWFHTGGRSAYHRRRHGRPAEGIDHGQLVAFAQNHDQIGNRVSGDRLAAGLSDGRLRIAAALVLASPYVPMLFEGEEWGCTTPFQYFTDHQDRELGRAVAQGRRAEFAAFGWEPDTVPDPQDPETFARSRLDWSQLGVERHAALLDWHRRLIALRRAEPELGPGGPPTAVEVDRDAGWLRVDRGSWSIAVNLAPEAAEVPCPDGEVVLASAAGWTGATRGGRIVLDPESVVVVATGPAPSAPAG